jgi:rRNA-processing protein FCF1
MKVLLDTSFLVAVMEMKIDLVHELRKFGSPELHVIDLVVNELKRLSEGKGKAAKNANLALQFLGRRMVRVIRAGEGSTDRKLAECAEKDGSAVCTIDRKLKDSLLKKGIPVITIRQGRYLVRAEK